MATVTDTTTQKMPKETTDIVHLGNDIAAMKRRIRGFNLALGFLHQAYSEELLEGVEQLGMDIEREAERLEKACDDIIERQLGT